MDVNGNILQDIRKCRCGFSDIEFSSGFKRIRRDPPCSIVGFSEVEILVCFNTLWPSKGYKIDMNVKPITNNK